MASRVCRSLHGHISFVGSGWPLQACRRVAGPALATQTHVLEGQRFCASRSLSSGLANPAAASVGIIGTQLSGQARYQSSSSSRSNKPVPTYSVANITSAGTLSMSTLEIPEILRGSSLHARDLFSLALTSRDEVGKRRSGALSRTPSAILPRNKEIVMSFGSVRALIGRDSGLIFDAHKPSIQLLAAELASTFETKMSEAAKGAEAGGHNLYIDQDYNVKMRYVGEPFELVFIEEILRDGCDTFNRRLRLYEPIVDTLLNRVSNEVFSDRGVQHLVPIKDSLQEFEMNVKTCQESLTHLLDNDEDMLGLLLTQQHEANVKGKDIKHALHETVELLFEEYARQLKNIIHEIHYLLKRVQSKQELVAISLDAYRNRMIRMNVYLAIVGIGLATSTTVAGFYGMNLINGYEDSPTAFNSVVVMTSIAGFGILFACTNYLSGARMQKRALERIEEIETICGALREMQSLDYAIKTMIDTNTPMTKDDLTQKLLECGRSGPVNEKEIDLLFKILDISSDGLIYTEDFRSIESFGGHNPPQHVRIAIDRNAKENAVARPYDCT